MAIFVNVVAFSISTVPGIGHDTFFNVLEWVSVIIFTLEYAARLYAAPEDPAFDGKGVWGATWRHVLTWEGARLTCAWVWLLSCAWVWLLSCVVADVCVGVDAVVCGCCRVWVCG